MQPLLKAHVIIEIFFSVKILKPNQKINITLIAKIFICGRTKKIKLVYVVRRAQLTQLTEIWTNFQGHHSNLIKANDFSEQLNLKSLLQQGSAADALGDKIALKAPAASGRILAGVVYNLQV